MSVDVFKIIEILISDYKCIVVPGLGAFILNKEANSDRLSPPFYKLSFNSQLIHDDGILASHIQQVKNISYDKALSEIQQAVQDIKQDILSNVEVACGNLGVFTLENNIIVYTPNISFSLPSYFGLSPITLSTLSQLKSRIEEKKINKKKFVFKQNLFAAGISAAAVVFLFFIPTSVVKQNIHTDEANFLTNVSSIYNPQPNRSYYIVVSSDTDAKTAQDVLTSLQQLKGFEQASILSSSNRHRVYTNKYSTKEEANKALVTMKLENPRFTNAWLLCE